MLLRDLQLSVPFDSAHHNKGRAKWYCVEYHYLKYWPKMVNVSTSKIVVELSNGKEEHRQTKEYLDLIDVGHISIPFDFDKFDQANTSEKKKLLLEALHRGCVRVAEIKGWDKTPFEHAYAKVIADNYDCWQLSGKPTSRTDRRYKAQLLWHADFERSDFYAVLFDKQGRELERKLIHSVQPGWLYAYETSGKLTWADLTSVVVTSKDEKEKWNTAFDILKK